MKAALLKKTGIISELQSNIVIEDIPIPRISDEEILIKIINASLNHRDLWIAKGMYSKITIPIVLGSDCSGVIHSKGKNAGEFKEGDEVLVNPGMNWGDDENYQSKDFNILGMPANGTLAEFVKVHRSCVYKKPSHLSFEQMSAFPLAGVTAFRALFKKAAITENDTVLITGIGGGVAALALVFAIKAGAKVFVTSGSDLKIEKAISSGAASGVNYTNENWDKELMDISGNKINVILDGAGGESYHKYIEIINYGGRIVTYGATLGGVPQFNLHRLYWKQIKLLGSTMGSPEDFSAMMKFIDEKRAVPVIDEVFPLENICDAFGKMDTGRQFGKIVIKI